MSQPVAVNRGTWILEHVLALLSLGSFVYGYWLMTKIDLDVPLEELQSQLQLPPGIVLAGTLSVLGAIWFWFRMFKDFIRHRPARYAGAWAAFLLIAAHLAALVYFIVIWRPRSAAAIIVS